MSLLKTLLNITSHPLTRNKKLSTLIKFFNWQFTSIFFKSKKIIRYGSQTKLLVKRGYTAATGCYYCGLIEFEIMGFILHFLNKDDLFVDVGSNVGTFILLASGEKKANSIAFEPDLQAFNYLIENIKLNNLDNVTANNIGVSSKSHSLKFTTEKGAMNHVVVEENQEHTILEFDSIDNKCEINAPAIIKIDVEGYEKEVVLGMVNSLKNENLKAVILECNSQNEKFDYNFSEIEIILKNNQFEKYDYNPFERQLIKITMNDPLNIIFIRDFDFVNQRINNSALVEFNNITF